MQSFLSMLSFVSLVLGTMSANKKLEPDGAIGVKQYVMDQVKLLREELQLMGDQIRKLDAKMEQNEIYVKENSNTLRKIVGKQENLYEMQSKVERLERKVARLRNSTPVAFHVQRSSNFNNNPPINVEFDRIQYEIGGVWNRPGHTFIVPVKGVYVFHLSIIHGGSGSARVGIMRDGTLIQQAYAYFYSSAYRSASASAVIEMEPFNQVYCRLLSGYLYSDSNYPLHFVGYLLYSLE